MLTIIILFCSVLSANSLIPQVTIPSGTVQGYYDKSNNGKMFAAFEGIPYARPPLGKYRFREPQPTKPWKGIWIANQTSKCIQYNHYIRGSIDPIIGQEDCLHVNVYTPQLSQTSLLNVIVNIHGGAFVFGYGHMYGPKILMNTDVVYVNFNYRLGALGFLSTEDDNVPGNNGLKDQSLALKWVKENIQYFGGNPDQITISGISAGGVSVTYHYLSPMSAGLFHRGIAMSGSVLNPWAQTENSLEKAKKLAASVGCYSLAVKDMIDCMRWRPARNLVRNIELFMPFLFNPFTPFGPVVEKQSVISFTTNKYVPTPFLTERPYDLLHQSRVNDAPLILSFVEVEGLYPGAEFQADPTFLPELEKRWEELAPHVLDYFHTVPKAEHASIAQKTKQYYLKNQPISQDTFPQLMQMIGDRLFVTTIETSAKLFARAMKSPVYLTYFTYRGSSSKSEILSKRHDNYGCCHGDDLIYIFSQDWINKPVNNDDKQMTDITLANWLAFSNTGTPQLPNGIVHTPIAKTRAPLNYLHIASPTEIKMKSADTLSNRQFWNSLPFDENQLTIQVKEEL